MRYLLLLILALPLFAVDDSPRVEPTTVDRVQGVVDPTTGKIESLQVWDVNTAVDPIGQKRQIGERVTIITRETHPTLFAALDNVISKTSERDAAHKDKKPKEEASLIKTKVK